MKRYVLGRDRWYYKSRLVAWLRAFLFRLEGYHVIISTVYLLENGTSRPYFRACVLSDIALPNPRPKDAVEGKWYRVIPFVPQRGNVDRSCAD